MLELPKFQYYLKSKTDIEKSIDHGIIYFYFPLEPDLQYPMKIAYENKNLKRDDIFVSISTINTIPSVIESKVKSLIYADMIVWNVIRDIKIDYLEWLLKSWKRMNTVIVDHITRYIGLYFDEQTEIIETIEKLLDLCKLHNLIKPALVYVTNTDKILKLNDYLTKNDIKLCVHLSEKNTSENNDKSGLSLTIMQNTFYRSHNIAVMKNNDNMEVMEL